MFLGKGTFLGSVEDANHRFSMDVRKEKVVRFHVRVIELWKFRRHRLLGWFWFLYQSGNVYVCDGASRVCLWGVLVSDVFDGGLWSLLNQGHGWQGPFELDLSRFPVDLCVRASEPW